MSNIPIKTREKESLNTDPTLHALISYRAIVAGLLITFAVMLGLSGLGLAVGGMGFDQTTTVQSAGLFGGIWFMVSFLIALFLGSYFAARISKFRAGRVGSVQGLVIASLFIFFLIIQASLTFRAARPVLSSIMGYSNQETSDYLGNQIIDNLFSTLEDELVSLNLKSSSFIVSQGVARRFFRGDVEGVRAYLNSETNLSPSQVDSKVVQLKAVFDKMISDSKETAAIAIRSTGWSLFLLVFLGAISSLVGGGLGSLINFKRPFIKSGEEFYPHGKTA